MNISINMAARKTFKALIGLIILILFSFIYFLVDLGENSLEEKIVTKIIDGDTVIVEGGENIRLLGIDCDERGKKCYDEAKNYLEENLLNKKVSLESDLEDKDRYERSLRYIFLNRTNINLKMVEDGYCVARFENQEPKYKEDIQKAEKFAIENKIGCKWSE